MTRTLTRIFWLAVRRWHHRRRAATHQELAMHALDVRIADLEAQMRRMDESQWAPAVRLGRPRLVSLDDQN